MCATSGFDVNLIDTSSTALDRATSIIQSSLDKLHGKGKLEQKPQDVLNKLECTTSIDVSFVLITFSNLTFCFAQRGVQL